MRSLIFYGSVFVPNVNAIHCNMLFQPNLNSSHVISEIIVNTDWLLLITSTEAKHVYKPGVPVYIRSDLAL